MRELIYSYSLNFKREIKEKNSETATGEYKLKVTIKRL